jgi:hypothetical protein
MSTIPQIEQLRRSIVMSDGTVKLEVTTKVIDQGDLPFPDLFVLTITDTGDPKSDLLARVATPFDIRQTDPSSPKYVRVLTSDSVIIPPDTFARISNINDLTGLPRDRTTAIRAGVSEYLSSVSTLIYDNITTADAAYKQVISRLSSLVTEWRSAFTSFVTNPTQVYALPQAGASVESERIAVYTAAKNTRIQAEAARDAAVAEKEACVRDCEADRRIYDFLVVDVSFLQTAASVVQGITETSIPPGTPTTTNAKNFVLQTGSYASDPRSYASLLASKLVLRNTYASTVAACSARCQTLAAAALEAQNAVTAAQTVEREALARVYEVCPTFDPTTV